MQRFAFARAALVVVLGVSVACGDDAAPTLEPIAPQNVNVNATLVVDLVVMNSRDGLSFGIDDPDLPAVRSSVTGGTGGGSFRWTPLASHVGTHEFTIRLMDGGDTLSTQPLVVTVNPAEDAAPIFIRPGAGGTFDLARDPCVAFDIEVRDDDSRDVEIRAAGELPEGGEIVQTDPKSGTFEWCPTPDQIDAAERWTIRLEADDGDHPPTGLNYVAVLRTDAKPGCPGDAPVVTIASPAEGATASSSTGYVVLADVSDDMGLRDAPLLFYTTSAPDDPSAPDVTAFEQVVMTPASGQWSGRIPDLRLADGATQEVFVVVSATDNDDASGAACDHRTDSALRTFVASGGGAGGLLPDCDPCSESTQCSSGLCATDPSGSVCVEACSGDGVCDGGGECGSTVTTEGGVRAGCGPTDVACGGGGGECTDDGREPDDSVSTARPYTGPINGQICADDPDHSSLSVVAGTRVTVTLDGFSHASGDLDLQLLDGSGTILGTSENTTDSERVEHCFPDGGTAIARVTGYDGDENAYALRMDQMADPAMCCQDDPREDNDTRATASVLTFDAMNRANFDGTICPDDDDFYRFSVTSPGMVEVTMEIATAGEDLDLELLGPTGLVVASSRGTTTSESIARMLSDTGTYTVRVLGFRGAASEYLGEVELLTSAGCTSSNECDSASVCDGTSCVSRTCSGATCPSGHVCPTGGPAPAASECGMGCTVNGDCRSSEACKWFPEGRYCGRRGAGANGDACTNLTDCGGQRACVPWPGGTCARAACASNADCESDTYCIATSLGYNVCAKGCWDSDDDCRLGSGYICDIETDVGSMSQLVCVPG